jgi:hypothetical protein
MQERESPHAQLKPMQKLFVSVQLVGVLPEFSIFLVSNLPGLGGWRSSINIMSFRSQVQCSINEFRVVLCSSLFRVPQVGFAG